MIGDKKGACIGDVHDYDGRRMKTCPSSGLVYPDESTFCFVTGDTLQPTEDPLIGTTVDGRFRVEGPLDQGPWAKAFRARFRLLARPCVLKVFARAVDEEGAKKFLEAVTKARRCSHPNVVDVAGGGTLDDGRPYVVHAASDGKPLSKALGGAQSPATAVGLLRQMLLGLGRIHDFGAIHGNLRPSNLLVTPRGHLEMIDVGLGRSAFRDPWEDAADSLTAQKYLAPELSSSVRASHAADIYAVGVVAFELLAGRVPFDAPNVSDLRTLVHQETTFDVAAELPEVPDPIRSWLGAMMHRIADKRPANPHQALEELDEACAAASVKPVPDPGGPPPPSEPTLDPNFARWQRFFDIFQRMAEAGGDQGSLSAIAGRMQDFAEIGKKALYQHNVLQDVAKRARDGRAEIAEQMAGLNTEGKEIRRELSPLRVAAERHGAKTGSFPDEALALHQEIVQWEGRFGFAEPYRELADAYRAMADLVEKWWGVRNAQLTCEQDAAAKEEQLHTIDQQLDELREALRIHESNLAEEVVATENELAELGREADRVELELLDLASRFTAPLRSKPQLGPLFRELSQA